MTKDAEKTRLDADAPPLPVMVHAQYVKDFSFENPSSPDSLRQSNGRPEMDVKILLDANRIPDAENPDLFESILTLTVNATRDGKPLFIAQIAYAALVTLKDAPPERINPVLFIDVPRMIFPFARQLIATASAAGGFPPLLLNPIDFRAMYISQREQQKAQTKTAAH